MSSIDDSTQAVNKTTQQFSEFRLIPAIIRRPNGSGEIFFAPLCSVCGELITDFSEANICVLDRHGDFDWSSLEKLADLTDGTKVLRIPGETVAVHWQCDSDHYRLLPWKPMRTILKSDQRFEFEKPLPPPVRRPKVARIFKGKRRELGRAA